MTDDLPIHPSTGLRALDIVGGRPVWPVLGGSGDAPGGDTGPTGDGDAPDGGDPETGPADDGQGDAEEADPEGTEALGDPGKRALDATKAKWKSERDRRRKLEAELAELRNAAAKDQGDDGDTPDAEEIRRQAEQAATAKANQRIIRAELRAAAAGKLADPSDVAVFLDPAEFEVNENGEVDAEEIAEAISDLLTRKPHLAAGPTRRFQGGADGGAGRSSQPKTLDQQIAAAEAAGDLATSVRLKQQKLAQASKTTK